MHSNRVLLAQKYAQAYLQCFGSSLQLIDLANFQKLRCLIADQHELYLLVSFLGANLASQNNFNQQLVSKFSLPVSFIKFLDLLVKQKVVVLLDKILEELIIGYQILTKNYIFVIKSVTPIPVGQLEDLKTYLINEVSLLLGYSVVVTCELQLDQNLIAGLQATNPLFFWDGSVRGRLQKLESALRLS